MTQTLHHHTSSLSTLAAGIKPSITMSISALATQMKKQGDPIISMSAGEPDFDTPDHIKQAGIASIQAGKTKYTAAAGIPELRTAIANKYSQEYGVSYTQENVIVSSGGKHSLFNIMSTLLNPGDEVIIPTPYWVSYPAQVEVLGGRCVYIETTEANNLKITPAQLEAAITPKTKLFILNSPSNPTGMVYTQDELAALAAVLVKHQIHVVSDELYEKLSYGHPHVSIAQCSEAIKALTLIVNGVSKAYSMTGWRIGYCLAPAPYVKAMSSIQSHATSNPAQASQWAALEAITGPQEVVATMKDAFIQRRDTLVSGLNALPGITCIKPEGAFYAFPNISATFGKESPHGTITDDVTFCEHFLKDQFVACVPGSGFGAQGFIRLSYATSLDTIQEALSRIALFLERLQ